MSGYWYDDYEPSEPSEIDQIVNDAIKKVTDYIINNSKFDIELITEQAKDWETKYNECKQENRKFFSDITEKTRIINELKSELERKRTQLGILPFEPGEDVYFIYQDYSTTNKFTCPKCNGKGRVTINHDGISYKATCPMCNDSIYPSPSSSAVKRESSYNPYKVALGKITKIEQTVVYNEKTKEPETETKYYIQNGVVPLVHIRKQVNGGIGQNRSIITELETIANELNTCLRDGCLIAVGREIPKDESIN